MSRHTQDKLLPYLFEWAKAQDLILVQHPYRRQVLERVLTQAMGIESPRVQTLRGFYESLRPDPCRRSPAPRLRLRAEMEAFLEETSHPSLKSLASQRSARSWVLLHQRWRTEGRPPLLDSEGASHPLESLFRGFEHHLDSRQLATPADRLEALQRALSPESAHPSARPLQEFMRTQRLFFEPSVAWTPLDRSVLDSIRQSCPKAGWLPSAHEGEEEPFPPAHFLVLPDTETLADEALRHVFAQPPGPLPVALVVSPSQPTFQPLRRRLRDLGIPFAASFSKELESTSPAQAVLDLWTCLDHAFPARAFRSLLENPCGLGATHRSLLPLIESQMHRFLGFSEEAERWENLSLPEAFATEKPTWEALWAELRTWRDLSLVPRIERTQAWLGEGLSLLPPPSLASHPGANARRRATARVVEILSELKEVAELGLLPGPGPAWTETLRELFQESYYIPEPPRTAPLHLVTPEQAALGEWSRLLVLDFQDGFLEEAGPSSREEPWLEAALRLGPRGRDRTVARFRALLSRSEEPASLFRAQTVGSDPTLPSRLEAKLLPGPEPTVETKLGLSRARQVHLATTRALDQGAPPFPEVEPWARSPEARIQSEWTRAKAIEGSGYLGILASPSLKAAIARRYASAVPLSATALESFAKCPFLFFSRHILKLDEDPIETEDVDARRRGSLLHRAVEKLLSQYPDFPSAPDLRDQALSQVLEEVFEEQDVQGVFWEAERNQWRGNARIRGLLEDWLDFEAQRPRTLPKHALEWSFGGGPPDPPALVLRHQEKEARLRGRVDRIDFDPKTGDFAVFDYKSSAPTNPIPQMKARVQLQLPLYLLATQRLHESSGRPLGAAYLPLKRPGEIRLAGQFGRGEEMSASGRFPFSGRPRGTSTADYWLLGSQEPDLDSLLAQIEVDVVHLAERIRQARFFAFRHPQDHDCVERCRFAQLCRVRETSSWRDFGQEALFQEPKAEQDPEGESKAMGKILPFPSRKESP